MAGRSVILSNRALFCLRKPGSNKLHHAILALRCPEVFRASAWGMQWVVAGDYALTRSGHFSLGVQARVYYLDVNPFQKGRIFPSG